MLNYSARQQASASRIGRADKWHTRNSRRRERTLRIDAANGKTLAESSQLPQHLRGCFVTAAPVRRRVVFLLLRWCGRRERVINGDLARSNECIGRAVRRICLFGPRADFVDQPIVQIGFLDGFLAGTCGCLLLTARNKRLEKHFELQRSYLQSV